MLSISTTRNNFIDCRRSFRADPLTMYSIDSMFNHEFSMPSFYKLVFAEFNLDLDRIYDDCEEKRVSFGYTIETLSDKLFGLAKPNVKNKLIYNYFHDLGLELLSLVNEIDSRLKEYINVDNLIGNDNIVNHSNAINMLYSQSLELFKQELTNNPNFSNLDVSKQPEILRVLNCIPNFISCHLKLFKKLIPNLTDTFNNVIKNEYRIRFNEGSRALNRYLDISRAKDNMINSMYPKSFGGTTFINASFNNFSSFSNSYLSIVPTVPNNISVTSTLSYIDTGVNITATVAGDPLYTTLSQLDQIQSNLQRSLYIPKDPRHKFERPKVNKKTPGVKQMNKSLKVIRKFIPNKDLTLFLRGGEFTLDAERYRWGFRLRSRNSLIKYSHEVNNYSIMWDLNIYDKVTDSKLARSCIVFRGSTILDNVLSVWMALKTGKEDYILANSGIFDKGEYYKTLLEPVINEIKKKTKLEKEYRVIDPDNCLNQNLTFTHSVNGELIETTLDGFRNRFENSRRNAYLERVSIEVELKGLIRNWLKDFLIENGMDKDLYNYTTNLDVSFGEAIDYEAFQLFDVKIFDKWVKPLKWSTTRGKKFLLNKI